MKTQFSLRLDENLLKDIKLRALKSDKTISDFILDKMILGICFESGVEGLNISNSEGLSSLEFVDLVKDFYDEKLSVYFQDNVGD